VAAFGLAPIASGVFNLYPVAPLWGGHFIGGKILRATLGRFISADRLGFASRHQKLICHMIGPTVNMTARFHVVSENCHSKNARGCGST
jgi:membrane-associated protease RseP (regulator of RpoE activity)